MYKLAVLGSPQWEPELLGATRDGPRQLEQVPQALSLSFPDPRTGVWALLPCRCTNQMG